MLFDAIIKLYCRHFNSDIRQLQLKSEIDDLDLSSFIAKHGILEIYVGLSKLVSAINVLAPRLPKNLGDASHNFRYLRRAVMRHE